MDLVRKHRRGVPPWRGDCQAGHQRALRAGLRGRGLLFPDAGRDGIFNQVNDTGLGDLANFPRCRVDRATRAVKHRVPDQLVLDHVVTGADKKVV
jgi:hypothetical protein